MKSVLPFAVIISVFLAGCTNSDAPGISVPPTTTPRENPQEPFMGALLGGCQGSSMVLVVPASSVEDDIPSSYELAGFVDGTTNLGMELLDCDNAVVDDVGIGSASLAWLAVVLKGPGTRATFLFEIRTDNSVLLEWMKGGGLPATEGVVNHSWKPLMARGDIRTTLTDETGTVYSVMANTDANRFASEGAYQFFFDEKPLRHMNDTMTREVANFDAGTIEMSAGSKLSQILDGGRIMGTTVTQVYEESHEFNLFPPTRAGLD